MSITDRIEKRVTLNAPQARVWKALSDATEFGKWFGVSIDGPFIAGRKQPAAEITIPKYEHITAEFQVERVEPESYFSYRWHPYAVDAAVDYSNEPTTLVEFKLEQEGPATVLTIVESGFDRIPLARRAEAFRMKTADGPARSKTSRNMSARRSAKNAAFAEAAPVFAALGAATRLKVVSRLCSGGPASTAGLSRVPASPGRQSPSTSVRSKPQASSAATAPDGAHLGDRNRAAG